MADIPIAVQLAAAILGGGLMAADSAHVSEQQAQAEELNEIARALEAQEMDQTIGALRTRKMATAMAESGRAVKEAAAATIVELERQGMDKEAIGAFVGGLLRAGGGVLKGIGAGAQALGKVPLPTTGTTRLRQAVSSAGGAPAATGSLQQAGSWLKSQGSTLSSKGQAAATAAPAASLLGGKPLINPMTKAKLIGGGALLGAGYMGMKGLQSARDYMMQPTGYGHPKVPIMHNVNAMGYPQY